MTSAPNIDSMIDWVAFYTGRLPSRPKPAGEHKMHACCPFHREDNPSFWFNTENGCFKCEAGCASGNATTFLAKMEGITTSEAWAKLCALAGVDARPVAAKPRAKLPLTVEGYAAAKRFPPDFLASLSVATARDEYGLDYVAIPYFDADGARCATKRRYNPQNEQRFGWDKGGKVTLYGAWLDLNKQAKAIVLVEGESDAQSCWLHGIPCLGVPGAGNYQAEWTQRFIGDRDVYLHIEPEKSGEVFRRKTLEKLYESGYKGKVYAFSCAADGCKDPSDLHIALGDDFRTKFDALIRGATKIDLVAECMKISTAVATAPPGKQLKKLATYLPADLYGKQLERPPIIVHGMVPSGLTVLAGAPKRGKSWLALALGICVAEGKDFLGMKTTQGDVLYLDLESRQYRIIDRLAKLIVGSPPRSLHVSHDADRLDGDLLAQLEDWCSGVDHPVLIIIDTLGRVKGGSKRGENAYEADTRIFGQLQRFAQNRKLAVVCVHHLRKSKDSDDWYERISGSNGLTGVADAVLGLGGKRGEEDSTLSISSRDFGDAELVLAFEEGVWTLRSTNSEIYRLEKDYRESGVARGICQLMNGIGRWEGTASDLYSDICSRALPIEVTSSAALGKRLRDLRGRIYENESIMISDKRTGGRRIITLQRVGNGF